MAHKSRISHLASGHNGGDLSNLISQAKSTLNDVGSQASHNLAAMRDRLGESVAEMKARAKRASRAARRQVHRADETIRANPYQSIGVAVGVGLLAGYFIGRRRQTR
ncbi:MAG TPA: hypothetical protein VGG34_01955 [Opitutaceae bacterium]|jgi:ElaB/YqjD/DUF883 family membrane-anchored ribosome-binding protein